MSDLNVAGGDLFGSPESIKALLSEEPPNAEGDHQQQDEKPEGDDTSKGDLEPKEDSKRFEYWQSVADKRKAEKEAALAKLEEAEAENRILRPIGQLFTHRPELLTKLERELEAEVNQREKEAKRPERPKKPANYDHNEALTDVNSESFKYRVAMDEYNENLAAYLERTETKRAEQEQMREQQARQQQVFKQKLMQAKQELMTVHKMSAAEATELLTLMADPKSLTLESMVGYYRAIKGGSQGDQRRKAGQRPAFPPLATQGGEGAVPGSNSDDALFDAGLKRMAKGG